MENSLVSIIVPIFNVEKFISDCSISLMNQTYQNIEFLFIDDASPDNSIAILQTILSEYPHRNYKIIKHQFNKGLPAARNTGLTHATGEYIYHCDGDDWVETDMIENFILLANSTKADIVYSDYYLTYNNTERYMTEPNLSTPLQCLKAILDGSMKFNVWNKMIKRKIYTDNKIFFPEGYSMGEDMTIIELIEKSSSICYLPNAYYHYVQFNTGAFTKKFNDNHLRDVLHNSNKIIALLKNNSTYKSLEQDIEFFKLNIKLPYLISMDSKLYEIWRNIFPESNKFIKLNSKFTFRIKLLQYAAMYHQDWYVILYNRLVVKFLYSLIYK